MVADWDADGDPDLGSQDIDWAWVWPLLNDGEGNFERGVRVNLRRDGWTPGLVAADFDNNGLPDLAATHSVSGFVSVVLNLSEVDPPTPIVGDANGDGLFDSSDLVTVFQAGEYEDGIPNNSTYEEGDWNGDGEFDSGDLVLAFQGGHYETAAMPLDSLVADTIDAIFAADDDDLKKPVALVA